MDSVEDRIEEIILSYPKVKKYLEDDPSKEEAILKNLKEIAGNFSPGLVRKTIKLIDATFGRLYDGVNFEVPQGMDLVELHKEHHLVLVPNHQSHADYIALTYAIFGIYELPVYIAGGINLNIFPIGKLFRASGAFFIRRSFGSDLGYKHTFEAYIFYLLKTNKLVEFFFEGGRSRTGKLLSPRFGLFQMLLEAHSHLDDGKELMFIPVALAHEQIPEEKSHSKELSGAKKEKEKSSQLLKIFKLANKKLGTIHVRLSEGIIAKQYSDIKQATHEMAFECFKAVGRAMPVTPISLLSMIFLDEPSGALSWDDIITKSNDIVEYCKRFEIPITPSLEDPERMESLEKALHIYISNSKLDVIKTTHLNETFYAIKDSERVAALYFKNMIIHHFIVPCAMNAAWFNIFNGQIKTENDLYKFLYQKRTELKYEFYLPTIKSMMKDALLIISKACGKEVSSLKEALDLDNSDLLKVASSIKHFSTAFNSIYEAYFLSGVTLKYFGDKEFTMKEYIEVSQDLFDLEIAHGRIMKYPESYTVPKLKTNLKYFTSIKAIENIQGKYKVLSVPVIDQSIEGFVKIINEQVSINLKFSNIQ
jgi:glycerol-3-phosphate O-acyltransferase